MIKADNYFRFFLKDILENGYKDEQPRAKYADWTPAHSISINQVFETYDISKGEFPITTLRNTAWRTGIQEILWIYQDGSNKLSDAHERGITWWDRFDIGNGTIGNRYGKTVADHGLIDALLYDLTTTPFSKRHVMSLWQVEDLETSMGLYPCAYETLWSVRKVDGVMFLDMTLVQRSSDYIMAGYINKIQYVALQMMMAGHCGYECGTFAHLVQNLHIYDRHIDAANEILGIIPIECNPQLKLLSKKPFFEYTVEDFMLEGIPKIDKIKSPLELAL